jgi:hypothetical protein
MMKTLQSMKQVIDILTNPIKFVFATDILSILMQLQQQQKKEGEFVVWSDI